MRRSLGASAALALALAACSADGAASIPTPAVVGADELAGLFRPRGDERLVLVNFWASW